MQETVVKKKNYPYPQAGAGLWRGASLSQTFVRTCCKFEHASLPAHVHTYICKLHKYMCKLQYASAATYICKLQHACAPAHQPTMLASQHSAA